MTYTADTPILGTGLLTAPQIDAVFHRRNPNAPPLGDAIIRQSALSGINSDFLTAEIMDETANWTSARAVQANNPSGLGATDDGAWGEVFATPEEGIHATVAHWLTYIMGAANPLKADDPRYAAVTSTGRAGTVSVIGQIGNGVWATAKDYATSVLTRMNTIVAESGGNPPMPVPYDRVHTSADIGPSRALDSIRWFIVHDTEGHFAGDESVLTSAAAPVESAHFLIGREQGQCVYIVPITETAWTAGNDQVGEQAVQVEMSGFAGNGEGYTDYQYDKLAEIYRWCVAQGMTGVPPVYLGLHPADTDGGPEPDDAGIIGHAGVPNPNGLSASPPWGGASGHTDPGPDFQWDRFIGLISGNAPQPPAPPDNKVNGHVLAGGFRALWESNPDRMRAYGLPLSEEYPAMLGNLPVTAMDLERVQFIYDVSTPDPFRVRVPLRSEKVKKI